VNRKRSAVILGVFESFRQVATRYEKTCWPPRSMERPGEPPWSASASAAELCFLVSRAQAAASRARPTAAATDSKLEDQQA
jgi:hypothetical protein